MGAAGGALGATNRVELMPLLLAEVLVVGTASPPPPLEALLERAAGTCNFPFGRGGGACATAVVSGVAAAPKKLTTGMTCETGVSVGGGGLTGASAFCFCSSDSCKASKLNCHSQIPCKNKIKSHH